MVKNNNKTVDEELDVLSEEEAIKEAKKEGVSPAVSRSVLKLRPFLIAIISAIMLVAVLALGIVIGLNSARMLVADKPGNGTNGEQVDPNFPMPVDPSMPYPSGDDYLQGYQDGFGSGFEQGLKYYQEWFYYNYPYYGYDYSTSPEYGGDDQPVAPMEETVPAMPDGSSSNTDGAQPAPGNSESFSG